MSNVVPITLAVARKGARVAELNRLCAKAKAREDARPDASLEASALAIWVLHGDRYSLSEIRQALGVAR